MFRESLPIAYDAPADLKKWPSLNNQRVTGKTPYLVYNGTLADCIRELLAKPIKQISLYDIVTERQPAFDGTCCRPATPPKSRCARIFPRTEHYLGSEVLPSTRCAPAPAATPPVLASSAANFSRSSCRHLT